MRQTEHSTRRLRNPRESSVQEYLIGRAARDDVRGPAGARTLSLEVHARRVDHERHELSGPSRAVHQVYIALATRRKICLGPCDVDSYSIEQ